jgi:hypothetical protein
VGNGLMRVPLEKLFLLKVSQKRPKKTTALTEINAMEKRRVVMKPF